VSRECKGGLLRKPFEDEKRAPTTIGQKKKWKEKFSKKRDSERSWEQGQNQGKKIRGGLESTLVRTERGKEVKWERRGREVRRDKGELATGDKKVDMI